MLALALTLVLALYILGPDLFSRLVVSQFAPARPRTRNRSEELARAVFLSAIPVLFYWGFAHFVLHRFRNIAVLREFLLGLYGEESLTRHADTFLTASAKIISLNFTAIIIPVYLTTLLLSVGVGLMIQNYGKLLRRWEVKHPRRVSLMTWLVRPWAAEWYMKLSPALLPTSGHYIRVDVLTKLDILFRGTLKEFHLEPDGSLVSITLINPQKFKRAELLDARKSATPSRPPNPALFWSTIEARFFVILASEVVTLNLNYVDPGSLTRTPRRVTKGAASTALAAVTSNRQANAVQAIGLPATNREAKLAARLAKQTRRQKK